MCVCLIQRMCSDIDGCVCVCVCVCVQVVHVCAGLDVSHVCAGAVINYLRVGVGGGVKIYLVIASHVCA